MKRLFALAMLFFSLFGSAQVSIPSYTVAVTCKKTTNILFPYRIQKADIGSADVIGHKDPQLENVLFLKAAKKGFAPTNLSVYTTDGKFYSFIVRYEEEPDTLNLSFMPDQKTASPVVDSFMDAQLDSDAAEILSQSSFMHHKSKSEEMKAVLNGIFLMDNLIWIRVLIKNHAELVYSPRTTRFFIRDKKLAKRTAIQESPIEFCWKCPQAPIPGHGKSTLLFAFPSFTLSPEKILILQMEEKNGERAITLSIPSKYLLNTKPLP